MTGHRPPIRIIGDILITAQNNTWDKNGATVTCLIRNVNVSHSRISRMLKVLVSHGLLEQINSGGANQYRISQPGRDFLREYYTFMSFAEDFGLNI